MLFDRPESGLELIADIASSLGRRPRESRTEYFDRRNFDRKIEGQEYTMLEFRDPSTLEFSLFFNLLSSVVVS